MKRPHTFDYQLEGAGIPLIQADTADSRARVKLLRIYIILDN